ncbi:tetratricopeptide repeat protein [uncultured Eudoraea sp.]|uniref:tetratricopeptide repeat protein n=1 Tax=uncultured Eudoraea sp. TaxID=1035614 RepID=UPI002605E600|nr:tetratricopeptide repeat protein [uncultured Eudoraea sp.]
MKTKLLILAFMCFALAGFSQKAELKAADKALKSGDTASAKSSLDGIQGMISGTDEKIQAQYFFLRGKTYADLANKGNNDAFTEAIDAFNKVLSIEDSKGKYSDETNQRMAAITADLVNSAVEDNSKKEFMRAAEKLYLSYSISPKDTIYLYYAASSAVNGGHYEEALAYYEELKDIQYDGSGVIYKATNVATGVEETMEKTQRDLMVKSGAYKDPQDEKSPSKKAEIVKNMALIYSQLGQDDKALQAFADARASDPNDVNLLLNEANLHYKLGDKDKFKTLMAEASQMAPDNADLQYNIGVINMEQGDIEGARAAYKKALEIDPNYVNAQLNLSTTYVDEGNGLIDEMNSLGNSKADIARYEELKQKKDDLFRDGAVILEDALKLKPDNPGVLTQLKNIYGALGDTENFMRIKKLLGE